MKRRPQPCDEFLQRPVEMRVVGIGRYIGKQADRCHPGGAAGGNVPHFIGHYSANRQHRDVDGADQFAEARQAEQRRSLGLARRRVDRARHQVIDTAVSGSEGLRTGVNGPPDQESRGRELPHPRGIDRISTQVHTVGTCGERDVDTIVDYHPRRGARHGCEDLDERARPAAGRPARIRGRE